MSEILDNKKKPQKELPNLDKIKVKDKKLKEVNIRSLYNDPVLNMKLPTHSENHNSLDGVNKFREKFENNILDISGIGFGRIANINFLGI
jgi:hypothetical protein